MMHFSSVKLYIYLTVIICIIIAITKLSLAHIVLLLHQLRDKNHRCIKLHCVFSFFHKAAKSVLMATFQTVNFKLQYEWHIVNNIGLPLHLRISGRYINYLTYLLTYLLISLAVGSAESQLAVQGSYVHGELRWIMPSEPIAHLR